MHVHPRHLALTRTCMCHLLAHISFIPPIQRLTPLINKINQGLHMSERGRLRSLRSTPTQVSSERGENDHTTIKVEDLRRTHEGAPSDVERHCETEEPVEDGLEDQKEDRFLAAVDGGQGAHLTVALGLGGGTTPSVFVAGHGHQQFRAMKAHGDEPLEAHDNQENDRDGEFVFQACVSFPALVVYGGDLDHPGDARGIGQEGPAVAAIDVCTVHCGNMVLWHFSGYLTLVGTYLYHDYKG